MPPYDYGLSSYPLPCSFYRMYSAIAEETIFQHVTPYTTPEQYAAAMREEVAESRLRNLQIMYVPAQPPAPKQQLITTEGAVIDLEDKIQTNTTETDVGTADSSAS
jgi:hypothetical protein